MSDLARILLVDDSDAVLNFERAALSGYYQLSVAHHGIEALAELEKSAYQGMVLDLSMPEMDGDEVLRRVRAQVRYQDMAVLVVSSEIQRAQSCMALGADDFLAKPVKADELQSRLGLALAAAERRAASRSLFFVHLEVGKLSLALKLDEVTAVLPMCALQALPKAPAHLDTFLEYQDEPMPVLDLAAFLGQDYKRELIERKLLVLRSEQGWPLALACDRVHDPEETAREAWVPVADTVLSGHAELMRCVDGLVLNQAGQRVPVISRQALLSGDDLKSLGLALAAVSKPGPQSNDDDRSPKKRRPRA